MTLTALRRAAVLGGLGVAVSAASLGGAYADAAAPTAKPAPVKKFDVCYPKVADCAKAKNLKVRAYGKIEYRRSYPAGHVTAYNRLSQPAYLLVTYRMKNGQARTKSIKIAKRLTNVGFAWPASSAFVTSITFKICVGSGTKHCGKPQTLVTPKLG